VEKSRAKKKKSRITWPKKGETNTRYFHLMANLRKQRNFVHALQGRDSIACSKKEKEEMVYKHFHDHIGTHVPRSCLLNLPDLGWQPRDLSHLDLPFSYEDIKETIMEAPNEKAPGPDGFIGLFFSHCWEIIKEDVTSVVQII
jgi:hypothetical protein